MPSHSEEMQRLGGDPDRLLQGENPDTDYPDDARHWLAVYKELLGFKHDMIGQLRDRLADLSESARTEVEGTDIPVMQSEASRFERRLDFWKERLQELGGSGHG
jgi:hypothetical protein